MSKFIAWSVGILGHRLLTAVLIVFAGLMIAFVIPILVAVYMIVFIFAYPNLSVLIILFSVLCVTRPN